MNRTKQPESGLIKHVEFVKPASFDLKNGIKFHQIITGSQPVLRLEIIFRAGTKYQNKPLQAAYTNSQLIEGTKNYSARQIADHFDYFGSFIQSEVDDEHVTLTIHCLAKNFKDIWPVLKEIIAQPEFPEEELKISLKTGKQRLSVNLNKVEFLARREFSTAVFGKHPYGRKADPDDFDKLTRDDLKSYYKEFYSANNCVIMAAGNFDDSVREIIEEELILPQSKSRFPEFSFDELPPVKKDVPKAGAVQCGIRMGKQLFNRNHPDFPAMNVLNTLLGGYFGSRLMTNIREDKGYTYGIGSAMLTFQDTGVFLIATEVGADVCKSAIKEIYYEIEKLRNEKVSREELELVKNYMLGSFLRNTDGPFAMADRFKAIYFGGLDYSYYDNYIGKINTITADEVFNLAGKYLDPASMTQIVVGDYK